MDIIEKNKSRILELSSNREKLRAQVESLDWEELTTALDECLFKKNQSSIPQEYGPASYLPAIPSTTEQKILYKQAYQHGEELISSGKIAAFTVAGGQGTRLGYDGPKGTLPVSPIKNKPLFQLSLIHI